MNVPALRFPEFKRKWVSQRLNDLLEKVVDNRGKTPPVCQHGVPLIETNAVGAKEIDYKKIGKFVSQESFLNWFRAHLKPNDVLFSTVGNTAICSVYLGDRKAAIAQNLVGLRFVNTASNFGYYLLIQRNNNNKFHRIQMVAVQPSVKVSQMVKLSFMVPSLEEQNKIAEFLGAVDAKIAALQERQTGLERYKRGLMQALFSQRLRFTKPDGTAFLDWEEKRLGDVFTRVTRKNEENNQNVLTISAQQGLVNQRDYFNKSVAAQDVTGYCLLKKGDFAYNKSYSKGYPMGAIKRLNNYDKGVVSTLYICFSTNTEKSARYFEQFFDFGGLNREIYKIAQEGARNHGLLNMSVVEFFKDMVLPFPHPDEQKKIADTLQSFDAKIQAVADQVTKMETFKKGLLQQMFV